MDLTPENKNHIDSLTYYQLLDRWRNAPVGDPWFQGETGSYWAKTLAKKRNADPAQAVADSKTIGWG